MSVEMLNSRSEQESKSVAIAIRQIKRRTGAVRNVVEQAQYLKQLGYSVVILAEKKSDDILAESGARFVQLRRWPFKGFFRRRWFQKSVEHWRKKNAVELFISHGDCSSDDLLVMHNCVRLHQDLCGGELAEVAKIHDDVIAASRYKMLIANSELMKSDFQQRYGVSREKIHVFYQGVDTLMFNSMNHAEKRKEGRRLLGLDDDITVLGLVTSGDLEKRNVEFFIRFAQAFNEHSSQSTRFVVIGNSKAGYLKQLSSDLGLADLISFHDPVANVDRVFHALDLHIFPAKLEEFGRVVLEGLACGIPSLVSNMVGASELMVENSVSFVISDYDLQEWVNNASAILSDQKYYNEVAVASEALGEKYAMHNQLPKMEELLKQFI
jgi:UDP-glucose:(heptosyl)LPS alpha-1,3-glucosyltransferase